MKAGSGPAVAVKAIAGPIQGTAEGADGQGELVCSVCAGLDHVDAHQGFPEIDKSNLLA